MLFNVFEPKLVDSLLYAMIEFFNNGIQGTATWSQLSLVPQVALGSWSCDRLDGDASSWCVLGGNRVGHMVVILFNPRLNLVSVAP